MSAEVLDRLEAAVAVLQAVELAEMPPAEQLRFVRRLEVLGRRLDAGTDRATALLDATAAFSLDGHRNVGSAVTHLGRLSGAEALGRMQTIRAVRELPVVAAAYEAGRVPTAHMRAIARVAANPRVHEYLQFADAIFAEQASTLPYDDFVAWLRDWVALADADGAARDDEISHERRRLSMVENFDGSWSLEGHFGAAQGAAIKETLDHFEDAEFRDDWAQARERFGPDATIDRLARTGQQRRADALLAMARWAGGAPADGRTPAPLVNVIVDQQTFEDELRRACGEDVRRDPNEGVDGRRCQTIGGTPLQPFDVLAAAMVGFVRRVVIDSAGTVIDLGRRRRLFTGSSREAAMMQAVLQRPGGLRCAWPGCDGRGGCLQADHVEPAAAGGATAVENSAFYCGSHNRLKETGFKPVQDADGRWTLERPNGGGRIEPAA